MSRNPEKKSRGERIGNRNSVANDRRASLFPGKNDRNSKSESRNSKDRIGSRQSTVAGPNEDAKQRAQMLKLKKTQDKYEALLLEKQEELDDLNRKLKTINKEKEKETNKLKRYFDAEKQKLTEQLKDSQTMFATEVERNKHNMSPNSVKKRETEIAASYTSTIRDKTSQIEKLNQQIEDKNEVIQDLSGMIDDVKLEYNSRLQADRIIRLTKLHLQQQQQLGSKVSSGTDAPLQNPLHLKLQNQSNNHPEILPEIMQDRSVNGLTGLDLSKVYAEGEKFDPKEELARMASSTPDHKRLKLAEMNMNQITSEAASVHDGFTGTINETGNLRLQANTPFEINGGLELLDAASNLRPDGLETENLAATEIFKREIIRKRSAKPTRPLQFSTELTTSQALDTHNFFVQDQIVPEKSVMDVQTEPILVKDLPSFKQQIFKEKLGNFIKFENPDWQPQKILKPQLFDNGIQTDEANILALDNELHGSSTPVSRLGKNRLGAPYNLSIIDEVAEPVDTMIQTDLKMADMSVESENQKLQEEVYKNELKQNRQQILELKKQIAQNKMKNDMNESYMELLKKKLGKKKDVSDKSREFSVQTDPVSEPQPKIIEKVETKVVEVEKLKYVYLKPTAPTAMDGDNPQPKTVNIQEEILEPIDEDQIIDGKKIPKATAKDIQFHTDHYVNMIGSLRQQNIDHKLEYLACL